MIGVLLILSVVCFIGFVAYKVLQHSGRLATVEAELAKIKAKLP